MQQLEKWPNDWDLHIIQAFNSYFSTKDDIDISFTDASINSDKIVGESFEFDNSRISLGLRIRDKQYGATLKLDTDGYVIGELFYVLDTVCQEEQTGIYGANMFTVIPDYIFTLYSNDVLNLAKTIEEEIWNDYWRRDNGNDGRDDFDFPVSPVDSNCDVPISTF